MSSSINDILLSDMTLFYQSNGQEETQNYSWETQQYASKVRSSASFVDLIPSLEHSNQLRPTSRRHEQDDVTSQYINTNLSSIAHALHQQTNGQKLWTTQQWYDYYRSLANNRPDLFKYATNEQVSKSTLVEKTEEKDDDVLLPFEKPVKGLEIHPDILPGFRYLVRLADSKKFMFDGNALQLMSIGRGYGKRLTFESESFVSNDNYFYCDTNPVGYALRLVALQEGDKFTLRDETDTAIGFAEITEVYTQVEKSSKVRPSKQVEKKVDVSFRCRIDKFLSGSEREVFVTGSVILLRERSNSTATVHKIFKCEIDGEEVNYKFTPGVEEKERLSHVSGQSIGDIPASYLVKGLLPHELPVIGTYVHPNIIVGAKYKVRCISSNKFLFNGCALKLQSIGKGYGKRITFQGESLTQNDNYFYSDTYEEGWAFTVEALSVGDTFRIVNSNNEDIGTAEVFRTDLPQQHRITDTPVLAAADTTVTCHFFVNGYPCCTTNISGTAELQKAKAGFSVTVNNLQFGWQLASLDTQNCKMISV